MKKIIVSAFLYFGIVSATNSQTADSIITKLFRDSYFVIKSMRQDNGIYLDALKLKTDEKPAAIAANGVGLVSLCIADSMYKQTGDTINWEPHAADLVKSTLLSFIAFKNVGATNANGYYLRYFNAHTGFESAGWGTEFSTIDNAIFAMGIIFCRNYFSTDTVLTSYADTLLQAMDFTAALSDGGDSLFMALDQYGNRSLPIGAFNEYMIAAWLAKNVCPSNPGYAKSQTYWNMYYSNPETVSITRPEYWGYELISDGGFLSDFIFQFTYYYCHHFRQTGNYMFYFNNVRKADSLWWTKACPGIDSYEWGLGAGEVPGGGYMANAIDYNNSRIVSPQIIAGFIPIYAEQSKFDLKTLYNSGTGVSVYKLPVDTSRVALWRYSRENPAQRCDFIQAIDFSTMLYGLASLPEYLGPDFFDKYNKISGCIPCISSNHTVSNVFALPESLQVYPNPACEIITVQTVPGGTISSLLIYDMRGVVMLKQTVTESINQLDISRLSGGLYVVKLISGKDIELIKLLKE
jgi:hypothetical protein